MDSTSHPHDDPIERKVFSRSKIVLVGFLLVIGYFLLTEHRAHVISFMPFLLLAACPLMHLFMHGGHGHHHGQHHEHAPRPDKTNQKEEK